MDGAFSAKGISEEIMSVSYFTFLYSHLRLILETINTHIISNPPYAAYKANNPENTKTYWLSGMAGKGKPRLVTPLARHWICWA